MASEKAKALAAQQKAERSAEKLRRKNSTDPRDWGFTKRVIETYKQTAKIDPQLRWWMLGSIAASLLVFGVLGIFVQPWWSWLIVGVAAAFSAALWVLMWRVKKANYAKYEGQVGSAEVAFQLMNNKKWSYEIGIAMTRQMDVVHRAIGEPGIVLVGEGNPGRVKTLMAAEAKKHEQVAYGVKVTTVMLGRDSGQVPLDQLAKHLQKLPKVMQPHQITEVKARLRALDAVRPKVPIPRGPMPSPKGMNRAMRGR